MSLNGYIYTTTEINSDGAELMHNGTKKMGLGLTNDVSRRFKEHHLRGSKASVGVKFEDTYDCDEVNLDCYIVEDRVHATLENFGYEHIKRSSFYEEGNEKIVSTTEVFAGFSKVDRPGIVSKGEQLSSDLIRRIISNITNVDLFKKNLTLLPHQVVARDFILHKFLTYDSVLLNHKPRSGKSFIAYDYMIEQRPQNVLLLTQFPILNGQWENEFQGLRNHNYNIVNVRKLNGKKVILDLEKPNFVMTSLQDAKGEDKNLSDQEILDGLKKNKFSELQKIVWDLIIFDEIHKGKETPKTDELLNGLKYKKFLGLSATPTKNLLRGTFTLDNTHRYTLAEENDYCIKYPGKYKMPKINHCLFNIDENVKKTMEYFNTEEGFSFGKFSAVDEKNNKLMYYNDHISLFNWFFCKGQFNRQSDRRTIIDKCESILLFVDNNSCQKYIADILKDLVGDVYDVYFTNSEINSSSTLLRKIKNEFIPKNGKKVIIIANKQLTTGITLKYCDMVVFMNDWKSIDDYIQASYRCQSPLDGKDVCYAIDLNPGRAYNILHSYIESNSSFTKYDINTEIKKYLDCAPIFETFGTELKKIDFEEFKKRVVDESGINNNFFPKSIFGDESDIMKAKEEIMKLGELESGVMPTERKKLDDSQPDAGKKEQKKKKEEREKEIRQTDEYQQEFEKLMKNLDYLRERIPLLSLSTEFSQDNLDSIFEELDNNKDKREQFMKDLLIN